MSKKITSSLSLNMDAMQRLERKTEELTAQGVQAEENHSGELNFAGCASGYCQAWD